MPDQKGNGRNSELIVSFPFLLFRLLIQCYVTAVGIRQILPAASSFVVEHFGSANGSGEWIHFKRDGRQISQTITDVGVLTGVGVASSSPGNFGAGLLVLIHLVGPN